MITSNERDKRIKELLDEEFLIKLLEVAKLYGWSGDYVEIGQFVCDLFSKAGLPEPNAEPYEIDYDDLER